MLYHTNLDIYGRKKSEKANRVWGVRGQFSERDADAYAIRKIREWHSKK
jgi:hypothetical protein